MKRYLQIPDLSPKILQMPFFLKITDNLNKMRLYEAEKEAISQVTAHLTNLYEIEAEIALGQSIEEQNVRKEYPVGQLLYKDGKFYKVRRKLLPQVPIDAATYWVVKTFTVEEQAGIEADTYPVYNGDESYFQDDIVVHEGVYYECLITHGATSGVIVHPAYTEVREADTLVDSPEKYREIPDPRNLNVVRCVAVITANSLCLSSVPENIPVSILREMDRYAGPSGFLRDAAKAKTNPLLPRKIDKCTGQQHKGWVVANSDGPKKNWQY